MTTYSGCLKGLLSFISVTVFNMYNVLSTYSGDHQQGPSTSQSGHYLRNGAEKIHWISPLTL